MPPNKFPSYEEAFVRLNEHLLPETRTKICKYLKLNVEGQSDEKILEISRERLESHFEETSAAILHHVKAGWELWTAANLFDLQCDSDYEDDDASYLQSFTDFMGHCKNSKGSAESGRVVKDAIEGLVRLYPEKPKSPVLTQVYEIPDSPLVILGGVLEISDSPLRTEERTVEEGSTTNTRKAENNEKVETIEAFQTAAYDEEMDGNTVVYADENFVMAQIDGCAHVKNLVTTPLLLPRQKSLEDLPVIPKVFSPNGLIFTTCGKRDGHRLLLLLEAFGGVDKLVWGRVGEQFPKAYQGKLIAIVSFLLFFIVTWAKE